MCAHPPHAVLLPRLGIVNEWWLAGRWWKQRLQDIACLQEAAGGEELMPGRMAALRAYTALFQADTLRTAELCREALEALPESDLFLRGIVDWLLSLATLFDGDLEDANRALEDLVRKGKRSATP